MPDQRGDVAETLGLDKGRHLRRKWLRYALLLALAAGGLAFWYIRSTGEPAFRYVTAEAATGSFTVTVTATGTVEPTNLVEISSELSGTLARVEVDHNDIVEVGTVLARLDTTKLEAQLAVSKASLDAAIARVAMAQATLDEARERYETSLRLEERGVTAHQDFVAQRAVFIRAQSELQSAMADRALAEANLDLHQAELDKACICSPIAGVVLDRAADEGQIVASSLSAPILFTIAEDLTKMELQVDIDEADIARISVGDRATFTVDAYDERQFPAEIAEIRFAPETIEGVVTYKAILTIDNADLALRPGMTATADITVAEISDALIVPNAALRYAPPAAPDPMVQEDERSGLLGMILPRRPEEETRAQDGRTVWVLREGQATEIAIVAGESNGRLTEILDGDLAPGDQVITDRIDA